MGDLNTNDMEGAAQSAAPQPIREQMSEEDLHSCVRGEIDRAIEFIDNEISPKRELASRYYDGAKFGDEEDGRSKVISLDVRDTVNALMPSLMRIFFGPENVAEFAPQGPEDVEVAQQATDYVDYIVKRDNAGFLVLHSAFKDALVRKIGVIKFWFDESVRVERQSFSGLDQDAVALLQQEIGQDQQMELGTVTQDAAGLAAGEIRRRVTQGKIRLEAVPPEEFLISPNAKSADDARLVAHRRKVTISDLVALGYEYDWLLEHTSNSDYIDNIEAEQRENRNRDYGDNVTADPSQRKVEYVEAFLRVDFDGDGIAELRRVCCVGETHEVVDNKCVTDHPFATFCPDPEPHLFFGTSVADVVMDIQRVKSSILRNMLDSLAQSIHSRTAVVEGQVNMQDALNTEVGGIVRMTAPGMVQPLVTPFVGKEAFPMLEYWDEIKEARTGISKAAAGLDADALQSTTKAAVAATITAAHQHIELIARVFAETGMRRLFRGILGLLAAHQQSQRMVQLRNKWVPINPAAWRADMDVIVNVAVGDGTIEDRQRILGQVVQQQEAILQTLGPNNPIVSLKQYRDTMARMVTNGGFRDPDAFFKPIDEAQLAQLAQQQQGQQQQDPTLLLAQVESKKIDADIAMKQQELKLKYEQMVRQDDRERDKLDADIALRSRELEMKYQQAVDLASIQAMVDRDRNVAQIDQQHAQAQAQAQQAHAQAQAQVEQKHIHGMAQVAQKHAHAQAQVSQQAEAARQAQSLAAQQQQAEE